MDTANNSLSYSNKLAIPSRYLRYNNKRMAFICSQLARMMTMYVQSPFVRSLLNVRSSENDMLSLRKELVSLMLKCHKLAN